MLTLLARLCVPFVLLCAGASSWGTLYFAVINLVTFALFCSDKRRALNGRWRIPEKQLLLLTLIGGAVGAEVARMTIRHKTRKWYVSATVLAGMVFSMAGGYALNELEQSHHTRLASSA
ncbi:DUF1294 domain-containing protein [Burkholderia cenocepacia]|uniref:DUF1294 domain-containing protein n=1 Tax=Burkholderia cenocepacia TaxID=95486 RepID=UPI000761A550|nr:DUF1294 domain-containing protein [Burkholderia cenocepacia]KWU26306.1 hypothetical protein AS149_25275 [Burkholderia cenocepacia]